MGGLLVLEGFFRRVPPKGGKERGLVPPVLVGVSGEPGWRSFGEEGKRRMRERSEAFLSR